MATTESSTSDVTKVIPSEEIIQHVHPLFLHLDYEDKWVRTSIIAFTFSAYVLHFFVTYFLTKTCKQLSHLGLKHRVFMSLAVSRATYGLSGIAFGGYSLFQFTNMDRDVVFGRTATSSFALTYTVGYFAFEVAAVILSDVVFKSFSKMLLLHHSLALFSFSMGIFYGLNHSFGLRTLTLEISTPFTCLCFVLLKAGMERSPLWKINQLLLVHAFHLRNVVECYMWYVFYRHWNHIWTLTPTPVFVCTYACLFLVSFVMTPYWGYKKTQQLFNPIDWNFQKNGNDRISVANGHAKSLQMGQ